MQIAACPLIALSIALAMAGCADRMGPSAKENITSPAFRPPPKGTLVLTQPLATPGNETARLGADLVQRQLSRQLQAAGYRVATADDARFQAVWGEEVRRVGGLYDPQDGRPREGAYGRALSETARRLAAEAHAGLVIFHEMVSRNAEIVGTRVQWDSVSRPLVLVHAPANFRYDGSTLGLSVDALAFAPDGALQFRRFGGTSLPHRLDPTLNKTERRTDLFADDADIASGVQVILLPLLVP